MTVSHVSTTNLSVTLGGKKILQDISFEVSKGEIVALIGPNGAGKSTLLRSILGLVPSEGQVLFDDRALESISLKDRARAIAYAPQGAPVHWPLTVGSLVALGRVPHQTPWQDMSAEDQFSVARVLAETDTLHLKDRLVTSLSGGERAGVMLARAMAVEAPFLFADEPVASLDPYHQLAVMETLQGLAQSETGVVVVLHDLGLALRFCDRLCVMAEGKIDVEGAPSEVVTSDVFERIYKVRSLKGEERGEPFIVPWERL